MAARPWCVGIESGGASGWPATDWIENIMLLTQPPEVYDDWVAGKVKFSDPADHLGIDIFGSIVNDDKKVAGGTKAVAATNFGDSPKGLFTVPPQCYLHNQASFITSFFPKDAKAGVDYDFFYLPPMKAHPELGNPVEGSGNLVTITKDSPAARGLHPVPGDADRARNLDGAAEGSFLSAHEDGQHQDLLQRCPEAVRRHPAERHDVPLRRLRPDARPDRHGRLLDRHGRPVNGKCSKDVATEIDAAWAKL